ncbi:MAG: hypothetical protein ACP5M0_06420 [Desulfomonilaceae bacterium]
MHEFVVHHELFIRLGCFTGIFIAVALGEHFSPRRRLSASRISRWYINLGIALLDVLVVRVLFPMAAVGAAMAAAEKYWGVFNNIPAHPFIAVVLYSFAIFLV